MESLSRASEKLILDYKFGSDDNYDDNNNNDYDDKNNSRKHYCWCYCYFLISYSAFILDAVIPIG
jgi:hypothetical protein